MSLEDHLAAIRAKGASKPPEVREALGAAIKDLTESGILDDVIKVGDTLPAFALKNPDGVEVTSQDLLSQGAVVLTVFRGHW
ncbi:MAG: hypothetical protein HQ512_11870 [Rhodospirillales bacterium]|nr:hypothetical protein [Rhodospirillales bacterium]